MNCGERCAGIGVKSGSFGDVTSVIVFGVLLSPIDFVDNVIECCSRISFPDIS